MKRKILLAAMGTSLCMSLLALATAAVSEPTPLPAQTAVDLPVVMYHHIAESPSQQGEYVISPEEFASDLQWLKAHGYTGISCTQLLDWYAGKFQMPEKPCIITFDDGFESTGVFALPLLEEYGFPGVVAVVGSVTEQYTRQPDHDVRYSYLDWAAVSEISHGKTMEVQCHTWDMHSLQTRRGCSKNAAESEEAYRAALEADLTHFSEACRENDVSCVPMIAYPYGAYTAQTTEIVKQLGYAGAFTCESRVNHLKMDDTEALYHLGRFNRQHGASSTSFFAAWEADA